MPGTLRIIFQDSVTGPSGIVENTYLNISREAAENLIRMVPSLLQSIPQNGEFMASITSYMGDTAPFTYSSLVDAYHYSLPATGNMESLNILTGAISSLESAIKELPKKQEPQDKPERTFKRLDL